VPRQSKEKKVINGVGTGRRPAPARATVLQKTGDWGAITLGSYIIGDQSIEADPNNDLFQHEYGHYLQSQSSGPLYLFHYGIPSGCDALVNDYWDHTKHWSEQDANRRGLNFFSKDSNFKGWRFNSNPIYDSNGNKIYKLSDDKGAIVNPKWWEFALFFSALSIIL